MDPIKFVKSVLLQTTEYLLNNSSLRMTKSLVT